MNGPRWFTDWLQQQDPFVLVPFFGYMIGVFVIAVIAHRYLKEAEFESEYYVGGRNFGAWVLAMSWVATMASGGTFLGYPSLIYSYGWSMAFWVSGSTITAIAGLGIIGKRINRLARQTGALTLVDLLRDRYDSRTVGVVYAVLIIVLTTVYLTAQFMAGARILENILGTSYFMGLLLFSVSVVAYTTYGGFRAVAWTDTLQGIVMIVGIVLLVPFAVSKVGGLEKATANLMHRQDPIAAEKGLPSRTNSYLYPPGPEKITKTPTTGDQAPRSQPWLPIGMGMSLFLLRGIGAVLMPTTVPRMLAFKDTKALRKALLLLAPYLLLMYGSSLITMNCAFSLNLGLDPRQSDQAVPELARAVAPQFLAGILIAAPFAAVMSTVDSALLVVSASFVRDLLQKTYVPNLSTNATRRLSYLATALTGVVVFFIAREERPFLLPLVIHFTGGAASVLFWPSLATLFWRRATRQGVLAGLIGGALVYIGAVVFDPFGNLVRLHPFMYGFPTSALLVAIGSFMSPKQTDIRLDIYFGRNPQAGR